MKKWLVLMFLFLLIPKNTFAAEYETFTGNMITPKEVANYLMSVAEDEYGEDTYYIIYSYDNGAKKIYHKMCFLKGVTKDDYSSYIFKSSYVNKCYVLQIDQSATPPTMQYFLANQNKRDVSFYVPYAITDIPHYQSSKPLKDFHLDRDNFEILGYSETQNSVSGGTGESVVIDDFIPYFYMVIVAILLLFLSNMFRRR